jgi:hypothetical protein
MSGIPPEYWDGSKYELPKAVRTFETGATRDTDEGKLDFEGYLSPVVLLRYAEYMRNHQATADGQVRPGDNWQKGMPPEAYMKSMLRHLMDVWLMHRGYPSDTGASIEDALCAVMFNAMGYLFQVMVLES